MSSGAYATNFGKPVAAATKAAAAAVMPTGLGITSATAGTWLRKGVEYTFFLSSVILLLYLILLAIHYFAFPVFAFTPDDAGVITIPSASGKQVAYPSSPAVYDRSCNFTGLYPYNTTFAMDVKLSADFTTTIPRVIWYRAAAPVALAPTDAETSLSSRFPASNLVLYFDPTKNDLKAFVAMNDGTATTTKTETCIENVPLNRPFRLAVVLQKRIVEIYMNGDLHHTIQTNADLLQSPVDANVYGPPNRVAAFAQIANITYWPYVISPKMIRMQAQEAADPTIFTK